jgi:hypothetical protein
MQVIFSQNGTIKPLKRNFQAQFVGGPGNTILLQ